MTNVALACNVVLRISHQLCPITWTVLKKIISCLNSEVNCRKSWNKIYHLASDLFLHYLVKFEHSAVHLPRKTIHCMEIDESNPKKLKFLCNLSHMMVFGYQVYPGLTLQKLAI